MPQAQDGQQDDQTTQWGGVVREEEWIEAIAHKQRDPRQQRNAQPGVAPKKGEKEQGHAEKRLDAALGDQKEPPNRRIPDGKRETRSVGL